MESFPIPLFEGPSRLLLQALGSGPLGALASLRVLQNYPGTFPWNSFMEKLCTEVPALDGPTRKLILKPALLLLPLHTQRNVLSFLSLALPVVPVHCIHLLAGVVSGENGSSDPWLLTLSKQLLTEPGMIAAPASSHVQERLKVLCAQLCPPEGTHSKLGWCRPSNVLTTRKRKVASEDVTPSEEEEGPNVKRVCSEGLSTYHSNLSTPEERLSTADTEVQKKELPEHIKTRIPRLRELLHGDLDTESWDESSLSDLQELCESCDPAQLQSLFCTLDVSQISPQSLLQLCCHLHSLTPDLSYLHSLALAKSLFLDRTLVLTSPAPRPLLSALSMFCMKYGRSACSALIGPLLLQPETGSAHIDFLCRMVTECLQPEQLSLFYGPVLEVPFCEGSLSVLHTLLEKQAMPSRSEFEQLLVCLSDAAEKFSKSVMFSKLLLTIMTRSQSLILQTHFGFLTNAVNANQTFLKKSLQGALKKVQEVIT
ncbi:Fanconi anemia group E protein [Bombina bombina]|uniref:Fanconi anemia group E protein n=1 Tax=Bombina bombina TaxID=8345 RepID=UPI00235AB421|nr:Fanconi anemia group E protein [Bombina bombina]